MPWCPGLRWAGVIGSCGFSAPLHPSCGKRHAHVQTPGHRARTDVYMAICAHTHTHMCMHMGTQVSHCWGSNCALPPLIHVLKPLLLLWLYLDNKSSLAMRAQVRHS